MNSYSMTQVETLTGISSHTLRVWERRYSFIKAHRSATNIRYYTDEQVKDLLNIGILIRNGYRISAIDKMERSKIHELVREYLLSDSKVSGDLINALVLTMINLDEEDFNLIFQDYVYSEGFVAAVTQLIYPFLNLVGGLWTTNKATPAQEHFISNLIRQKILAAIDQLPQPDEDSPRVILFLLEKESHEIGLLLAYYIFKQMGWKVYYLGQNVPRENIPPMTKVVKPDLLMTMFVIPRQEKVEDIIKDLLDKTGIKMLYSGNPVHFQNDQLINNARYVQNPDELSALLGIRSKHKSVLQES